METKEFLDYTGLTEFYNKLKDSGLGGGSSGPFWLQVEGDSLYAYYDDAIGEPTVLSYDPESGNLYATFETEAA